MDGALALSSGTHPTAVRLAGEVRRCAHRRLDEGGSGVAAGGEEEEELAPLAFCGDGTEEEERAPLAFCSDGDFLCFFVADLLAWIAAEDVCRIGRCASLRLLHLLVAP